jgi:hypothetical protein
MESGDKKEKSEKTEILPLEVIREDSRENSVVSEPAKINYLIKEYILGKPVFVKNTFPPVPVTISTTDDENILKLNLAFPYPVSGNVELHLTYKRHIELHCNISEVKEGSYLIKIAEAIIANKPRGDRRIGVENHEVFGHHFSISKNKIDINPMSFSVSNKVIFKDAERILSPQFPFLKIFDMDPTNDSIEKKIVKKFSKGMFLTDISKDSEKEFPELETVSAKEALADSYPEIKTDLVNKGVLGWILRPILYTNVSGNIFPIGYFSLKSTDRKLTEEDYHKLEEQETKIVERIKDANTIIINDRYKILNISNNGALLEVDNKEFQEYLLQRSDMTFDLLFKFMAGLRFFAKIHHIRKKPDGAMLVGVGFHGVVHTTIGRSKSKKILDETLGYLIKQGAAFV